MRRIVTFILLVITCCGFGQDEDPLTVVKAYIAAQHAGDIETEMSLCHPDIIFTIKGAFQCEGLEQIRGIFEWDAELNAKLESESFEVDGSTVWCSGIENNDWFRSAGIDVVKYDRIEFTVKEGKIKSITADASDETSAAVSVVMKSLMPWLQTNHPEKMEKLFNGSSFIYSSESAKIWMVLLKEWRKTKGIQ